MEDGDSGYNSMGRVGAAVGGPGEATPVCFKKYSFLKMKHLTWGWLANPKVLVQFVFRDRIPVFLTKLTNQNFF